MLGQFGLHFFIHPHIAVYSNMFTPDNAWDICVGYSVHFRFTIIAV